jgi:hypothetical protein
LQRRTARYEAIGGGAWRSGVKHDLSRVMELTARGGELVNGFGESVAIEPERVFPLLKSSDLAHDRAAPERFVIVTQDKLGDDTAGLGESAPLTFAYLTRHRAAFDARKSRIYRSQPSFAMFGIGPYSFAPYKVAISALYKRLAFRVVAPRAGKPVLFDDTVYFLACDSAAHAERLCAALDSKPARDFFEARIFWDEMRPITKSLLDSLALEMLTGA